MFAVLLQLNHILLRQILTNKHKGSYKWIDKQVNGRTDKETDRAGDIER